MKKCTFSPEFRLEASLTSGRLKLHPELSDMYLIELRMKHRPMTFSDLVRIALTKYV